MVLAVSGLSLVLALTAFNPAPHTGGDNAGYVALAHALLSGEGYVDLFDPARLPHTKYPPVFPALLAILVALGARTWVALKSVAVVSTVAAVTFTYLWAERRLGSRRALALATLVATSSGVVYYSHWILSDPTFLAFTMAALWALERADEDGASPAWLVGGVVAVGLAYFTRSAGLPLAVAVGGWLVLRRRWRAGGAVAAALGAPALLWWMRARGVGDVQYVSEFWMVDPYQPALGTVGFGGLLGRVGTNLTGYLSSHLPAGIVGGGPGPALGALGWGLALVALVGWALQSRREVGIAELFLPLYAALILLWPAVWSGDRFALPLLPLLFAYGAVALGALTDRLGPAAGRGLSAAAFLLLLLPALGSWAEASGASRDCARRVRATGAFACYGPRVEAFAAAAEWAGTALPDGSAVLARKPRIFFVLSGVPSRTFPFDDDPAAHVREADAASARYVLFDQWDGLASRYVAPAVRSAPGSFCGVQGFGDPASGAAQLLGILDGPGGGEELAPCPAGYLRAGWSGAGYSPSSMTRIPLLERPAP